MTNSKNKSQGRISFKCDQPTDLKINPIHFTLTNKALISSVWNLPGKTSHIQKDGKVTITV